jgi:hypothetical protein
VIAILLLLGNYTRLASLVPLPTSKPLSLTGAIIIVFLALSSCLVNGLRMLGFSTTTPRDGHYGRTYFRTMTNSGPAMSEYIEMEAMLNDREDL